MAQRQTGQRQDKAPDSQQNKQAPGYGDKKLTGPNRPVE